MRAAAGRGGILNVNIQEKADLYADYMPFLRHGGIFIATDKAYQLGHEVFMLLKIMDADERIPVAGRVVWVTPPGAQGSRKSGIGVHFSDQDDTARRTIENYLAGALDAGRATHTM